MRVEEWRALIAAFLDGRLSPEAFQRRFLEAHLAARTAGEPMARAIENLAALVSTFTAGDSADEEDLRRAAEDALAELDAGAPSTERLYDRFRAREDVRRFQFQARGCLGLGCVIALAWLGLVGLQVFAVSDQIQSALDWPAAPATFVGLVLAFVPFVGNILAFLGATAVWGWNSWLAGIVFFAAPAATLISGWLRWRAYRQ